MAVAMNSLCAVVPAAGRGTRLAMDVPKVFVPLFPGFTIWDAIHGKLSQIAERIVLVLSAEGTRFVAEHHAEFAPASFAKTVCTCQAEPLGMGDAIFRAADLWRDSPSLLMVWGDQFNLSLETLRACANLQAAQQDAAIVLPVVRMAEPYVEYVFDPADRLTAVRQSREGEECAPNGFADVGVFFLSGGQALCDEWKKYRATGQAGNATGEINFLPFLVYLSSVAGWPVIRYEACHPEEAVGINTPEDLAAARKILAAGPHFQQTDLTA